VRPESFREIALYVWERQLNQPYRWGGDDPLAGFDCSGLVLEGLKAAGVLPRDGDWNAETLLRGVFRTLPRLTDPRGILPGCLVFYNRGMPARVGHVEIVWAVVGGRVFTIGASGGGPAETSLEAAARDNAYVKIRPAVLGWVACVDPFGGVIGAPIV